MQLKFTKARVDRFLGRGYKVSYVAIATHPVDARNNVMTTGIIQGISRIVVLACLVLASAWVCAQGQTVAGTAPTVDLTQLERDWIKAHPRIVFGVDRDWAPADPAKP